MRAEVETYLEQVRGALANAPTDLAGLRDWYRQSVRQTAAHFPPPSLARREWVGLGSSRHELRALLQVPTENAEHPVLVYFHGGGYALGDPEATEFATARLALASGCAVLSVDYRLAPEHGFEHARADGSSALAWVREEGPSQGLDPDRVALGGDSSGAALALWTAIDADAVQPGALVLFYGWYDMELGGESLRALGESDILIPRAALENYRRAALGDDPAGWARADVLRAELPALADSCLVVGALDPLLSDSERMAARLREAGTAVEYHRFDVMPHGFCTVPFLTDAGRALELAGSFLASRLRAAREAT